ncbi:MAG TPA: formylglycine-generating enzyme family protein [Caulobacteraceae bacterium]|nr:formylglycine-generating enzyme family protein [Caulobacteraceae bacterium]
MFNVRLIALGLFLSACGAVTAQPAPALAMTSPPTTPAQKEFRDCTDICPQMVRLPAGSFQMGAVPVGNERHNIQPVHTVTLGAFAIGKYEVTRGEYAAFAKDTARVAGGNCETISPKTEILEHDPAATWQNPGFAQTDRDPVVCVSWEDAKAYVGWLSKKTGKPYRLLSESEWEYAARAGTTTHYWWGEDPAVKCTYANGADQSAKRVYKTWVRASACDDGHAFTAPVGSFAANAFGLHDMVGNVWEWVEDCYADSYDPQPRNGAPYTGGDCKDRVNRGGSWYNGMDGMRPASRDNTNPTNHANKVGFRVARDD